MLVKDVATVPMTEAHVTRTNPVLLSRTVVGAHVMRETEFDEYSFVWRSTSLRRGQDIQDSERG